MFMLHLNRLSKTFVATIFCLCTGQTYSDFLFACNIPTCDIIFYSCAFGNGLLTHKLSSCAIKFFFGCVSTIQHMLRSSQNGYDQK